MKGFLLSMLKIIINYFLGVKLTIFNAMIGFMSNIISYRRTFNVFMCSASFCFNKI